MIRWFRPRGRVVRRRPLRSCNWITCDRGALPLWVGLHPVNVREVSTLGRAPLWLEGVFA
nr:MAG TPA: hypothetical protein [Caudoviricetes sp.]